MPFNQIYDFVFDRFRAVRQEMVIQQIDGEPKIRMLEKMILFHVYSAFEMMELEYRCFDPVINRQHLSECLNILMSQYDMNYANYTDPSNEGTSRRAVFEAIFLMHNLLSEHSIFRFGSIPDAVAQNETAAQAFRLAAAFRIRNHYPVLSSLSSLPVFSLMALTPHIPAIQVEYLRIISSAFAPPAPPVPLKYLTRVLCPFEESDASSDYVSFMCQQFDARIERSAVRFPKANKNHASAEVLRLIPLRKWSLLERRLQDEQIRDLINFTCPQKF
jgi:SAC3 domain-containing protein 1